MDVIATLWKKPYYQDRNQKMIDAGVDVLRIKCSHWDIADISHALERARAQIDASGRPVKLLADLPEAKIRLGEFPQKTVTLPAHTEYRFQTSERSPDHESFFPVKFGKLSSKLEVGDHFYLGDGQLSLVVTRLIDDDTFLARTLNQSRVSMCTAMTFPRLADTLDHVTPALDAILAELPKSKPDIVAFSFVSSRAMIERLVGKLLPHLTNDWRPMIIAKIESPAGVANIDEILPCVNGIMVARGDLGLTTPYAELGLVQKKLVAKARQAGKYVIVATQALQSLLDNYLPMRSDILDVTNACLDGASAIMLCAETAHSETPERAVTVAKEIIAAVHQN